MKMKGKGKRKMKKVSSYDKTQWSDSHDESLARKSKYNEELWSDSDDEHLATMDLRDET